MFDNQSLYLFGVLIVMTLKTLTLLLSLITVGGFANMSADAVGRRGPLARFNRPIWTRVFGANKTWRGLLVGLAVGVVASPLLWLVWAAAGSRHTAFTWWIGAAVGLATLLGDAVTSGYKRLRGLATGDRHWTDPFDPAFGVFAGILVVGLDMETALLSAALACLLLQYLHPLICQLGYRLGLKAKPY
jgi:hypothetical protein